jgi:hypothetical protein
MPQRPIASRTRREPGPLMAEDISTFSSCSPAFRIITLVDTRRALSDVTVSAVSPVFGGGLEKHRSPLQPFLCHFQDEVMQSLSQNHASLHRLMGGMRQRG